MAPEEEEEKEPYVEIDNTDCYHNIDEDIELDYMWQCHRCGDINYTKKCSCGNRIL